MSFGGCGSAQGMINSLKANRALLKKKSYFETVNVDYKMGVDINDKYPKATKELLEKIRRDTIRTARNLKIIRISVFLGLFVIGLVYFLW